MNSSDVRIVRLIPTTADGSFTGGGGTFWDSAGVLQTAPPNTLRWTFDPSDLSKAPYALIEPEAKNCARNNTMLGAAAGSPGALPNFWGFAMAAGLTRQVLGVGTETNIDYIDLRFSGTATGQVIVEFESTTATVVTPGEVWVGSFYLAQIGGSFANVISSRFRMREGLANGTFVTDELRLISPRFGALREQRFEQSRIVGASSERLTFQVLIDVSGAIDFTIRIGLPQLERDRLTSPIKTSGAAVTRAADVIGPGAGLVYSSVPITEPLWAAGTYAKGAKVRDAQNFVFESLVDGNTAPLTDTTKTKWLPLGITNRWKVFDQAVNSQTSAPGRLTFAVKPGAVATTMMLLNMEGASVTVGQTESGYVSTKSLVSHEVDNWYDFYYEEPVRAGDAVFSDIPPFPNAMLTVSIDNGPLEAKIGACLIGKPMVIGKATASFKAGVLSYSTSTADTFGNITMVKRYNAPRMNFDVMIPAGSESVVYRILREYTDTEIGIIVGDSLSMGIGYGYLGQWDVPKSGSGRTAPIEFKGLV